MKYENVEITILALNAEDIITTSGNGEKEWEDENTDNDGWL